MALQPHFRLRQAVLWGNDLCWSVSHHPTISHKDPAGGLPDTSVLTYLLHRVYGTLAPPSLVHLCGPELRCHFGRQGDTYRPSPVVLRSLAGTSSALGNSTTSR